MSKKHIRTVQLPASYNKYIIPSSIIVAVLFFILYFIAIPIYPAIADYYFTQQTDVYELHRLTIMLHIFGGSIALLTGPFIIRLGLKQNNMKRHKKLGYIYTSAVLLGSIAGLAMAPRSFGGNTSHLGFATLAVLWISTLCLALYNAVYVRNYHRHSFWMIVNFSLTFAAVTLRIQLLPFAPFNQFKIFEVAYSVIAWTCWLPNIIIGLKLARKYALKP